MGDVVCSCRMALLTSYVDSCRKTNWRPLAHTDCLLVWVQFCLSFPWSAVTSVFMHLLYLACQKYVFGGLRGFTSWPFQGKQHCKLLQAALMTSKSSNLAVKNALKFSRFSGHVTITPQGLKRDLPSIGRDTCLHLEWRDVSSSTTGYFRKETCWNRLKSNWLAGTEMVCWRQLNWEQASGMQNLLSCMKLPQWLRPNMPQASCIIFSFAFCQVSRRAASKTSLVTCRWFWLLFPLVLVCWIGNFHRGFCAKAYAWDTKLLHFARRFWKQLMQMAAVWSITQSFLCLDWFGKAAWNVLVGNVGNSSTLYING